MKSPWTGNEKAFDPMFDESVTIHGNRDGVEFRQTIATSIFQDITGDSLTEDTIDTDREDVNAVCRQEDYAFVHSLRRGDFLERGSGKKYKVKEIKNDSIMGLVITARSV